MDGQHVTVWYRFDVMADEEEISLHLSSAYFTTVGVIGVADDVWTVIPWTSIQEVGCETAPYVP